MSPLLRAQDMHQGAKCVILHKSTILLPRERHKTTKECSGMMTKASLNALTMSRRTTLQMALAAATAGQIVGKPQFVAGQDETTGTWNWGGNAGHTGELPGPGLDLDSALGELWRMPEEEFRDGGFYSGPRAIAGYLDGVVYFWSGDGLRARRLNDGEFLWEQSPATLTLPATPAASPEGSPVASPQASVEERSFDDVIAIDGALVLVTVGNGHLWALDSMTGVLRWDFDSGSETIYSPTVVNHVAYCPGSDGVVAIDLGEQPALRWKADVGGWVLGVDSGYVYIEVYDADDGVFSIRALNVEDGSEYWRASLADFGERGSFYGILDGGLFLGMQDDETPLKNLVKVDQDGQVSWNVSGDYYSSDYNWVLSDTITTLIASDGDYGSHWIISRFAENGNPHWEIEVDASRWASSISGEPVLCAGKAYALVRDANQDKRLLVIVDSVTGDVFGAWDSLTIPLFVADGVMLARDYDTDEILAIGTVPAVLQAGGRAAVAADATLRGAPSDTAIERAQVVAGTLVDVTGESESSNGVEWLPVTVSDTDESGWLPADVLSGQDGAIRFSAIDLYEFGQFTAYPMFTAGTQAEIVETTELRGAPSESSALKATLDAGTLVTVTSAPTETDDGEWCPIMVDATNESGWVPLSVLTLAPNT